MLRGETESDFSAPDFVPDLFVAPDISRHGNSGAVGLSKQSQRHGQRAASACIAGAYIVVVLTAFHAHGRLQVAFDRHFGRVTQLFSDKGSDLFLIDLSANNNFQ